MDFWGRWIFFLTTTRADSSLAAVPPERTQVEYNWLPQPHAFARMSVTFGLTEIRNLCSRCKDQSKSFLGVYKNSC